MVVVQTPGTNKKLFPYEHTLPMDVASVRSDAGNHSSLMMGPPKFIQQPESPFITIENRTTAKNACLSPGRGMHRRAAHKNVDAAAKIETFLGPNRGMAQAVGNRANRKLMFATLGAHLISL